MSHYKSGAVQEQSGSTEISNQIGKWKGQSCMAFLIFVEQREKKTFLATGRNTEILLWTKIFFFGHQHLFP